MKSFFPAPSTSLFAVCVLAACVTQSPEVSPKFLADSTAVMDFSKHTLSSVTIEELVKSCQEATQFNFTYSGAIAAALDDERVDLPPSRHIPAADFPLILAQNGFVLRPIGPESLHVIAIERRAS